MSKKKYKLDFKILFEIQFMWNGQIFQYFSIILKYIIIHHICIQMKLGKSDHSTYIFFFTSVKGQITMEKWTLKRGFLSHQELKKNLIL